MSLLVHAKPLSQRDNRDHFTSQVDHPIHECRGMWHASEILHANNFLHPQNVKAELLLSDPEAHDLQQLLGLRVRLIASDRLETA